MSVRVHFNSLQTIIQERLVQAHTSIQVAVAWFTDEVLYKILLERAAAGISVIVIIRNDVINLNPKGIDWQELINAGGTLYFSKEYPALHHKFCVIDGKEIASGSYNWTYAAQRNHENLIVASQPELVTAFRQEFRDLLDHAREVESISQMAVESPPATDIALQQQVDMEVEYRKEVNTQVSHQGQYEDLVHAGNAAYQQKQYSLAESTLQKALLLKPDGLDALQLLAGVYWRTDRFEMSVETAKRADALGFQEAKLWNVLGLAYQGLKNFKEAIECFDRGIRIDPSSTILYRNKYLAQIENKQHKSADATLIEGGIVATQEIKKHRNSGDDIMLLHAYIDRAFLHSDLPEARKHAKSALEVYNRVPQVERDLHVLDDINATLTERLT